MMVDWVSISFHETDKIRLVSGPGKETASQTSLREKVRARLAEGGEGVVQREREYHGATEWKLSGTPFSGTFGTGGQQRAMISFLSCILRDFNTSGWKLVTSADISAKYHSTKHERYPLDLHTWFFLQVKFVITFEIQCKIRSHVIASTLPPSIHQHTLDGFPGHRCHQLIIVSIAIIIIFITIIAFVAIIITFHHQVLEQQQARS